MARGKRRAPIQPSAPPPPDPVDDFVSARHKVMLSALASDASSSDDHPQQTEPELRERNVLDVHLSDSDSDSDSSPDSAAHSDEELEREEQRRHKEREERAGWGGRKALWYGGDTHEYEIMEDEERAEALREEEEEAIRLRAEGMKGMVREDFLEDEEEEEEGKDREEQDTAAEETGGGFITWQQEARGGRRDMDVLKVVAPEVMALVGELAESRQMVEVWKKRVVGGGEVARVLYHLHASFVNNVAFYLLLRTDPEAEGVDLRTHPVLVEIVRIRRLLREAMALPWEEGKQGEVEMKKTEIGAERNGEKSSGVVMEVEAQSGGADKVEAEAAGSLQGLEKKARKEKRKKKRKRQAVSERKGADAVAKDVERLTALLQSSKNLGKEAPEEDRERKARKLNKLVGAIERERKHTESRVPQSADMEVLRQEPKQKETSAYVAPEGLDMEVEVADAAEDEAAVEKMLVKKAKKEARQARQAAESEPHVYRFNDGLEGEARRRASTQVIKNRGLTRYRPKEKKNPRTKNRLSYSKAVARRKGAVREYQGTPGGGYSGEKSGINMAARKGSRLSNV